MISLKGYSPTKHFSHTKQHVNIYNACVSVLLLLFLNQILIDSERKKKHTTKFGSSKIIVWGVHNPVIHSLAPGGIEKSDHELNKYSEYQNSKI